MTAPRWLQSVVDMLDDDEPTVEHRGAPRRPFMRHQQMAPCFGESEPLPTDFRNVLCRDISTAGISFYWPQAPVFKSIVIKLGSGDRHIDVLGNVVWYNREPDSDEYVVGCAFADRCET